MKAKQNWKVNMYGDDFVQ